MRFDRRIAVRIVHEDSLLAAGLYAVLVADPEIVAVDAPQVDGHVFDLHSAGADADVIVADYEHGLEHVMRPRVPAALDDRTEARVMVFTTRDSESEIRCALQAGVHGYLVQGCSPDEVVRGVKAIARGVRYFCPVVSQRMADSIAHTALTGRESDVLSLLSDGLSNKLIARQLDLATGTVKAHLRAILSKLGASSRTHAVLLAAQRGLVKRHCVQALAPESVAGGVRPRPRLAHPAPASVGTVHDADLIAFGRPFVMNPDLPCRVAEGSLPTSRAASQPSRAMGTSPHREPRAVGGV